MSNKGFLALLRQALGSSSGGINTTQQTLASDNAEKNNLDQSIADYSKAIDLDPNNALAYHNRGVAYHSKGNLDQAIADIGKAIDLDPNNALAYRNRGIAYGRQGKSDQAITDLNKAIDLDPKDATAYHSRGVAYFQKRELDQALADFNKAIDLNPQYAIAYYNRGNTYDHQGKLDQALADYNKAIDLDPSNVSAYRNRGIAYGKQGKLDQQIADYSKVIDLDPQDAIAFHNRGTAYAAKGNLDQAIADFSKAIDLNPNNAISYRNRGEAYADKGKLDRAITDFSKTINLDSQDAIAHYRRGRAYAHKGKLEQAIVDYSKAIDLDPKDADAFNSRGTAYARQGKLEQAITDFGRTIALDPEDATAYYNRGIAYRQLSRTTEAIADFEIYIGFPNVDQRTQVEQWIREMKRRVLCQPKTAEEHINVGKQYYGQKQENDAIREFTTALNVNPTLAQAFEAHFLLGMIYLGSQPKESIRHFDAATKIDSKHAGAYQGLGRAYRAENNGVPNEKAIRAYETAVTLDPSDAGAHALLATWYIEERRWGDGYYQCKLAAELGHKKAAELLPGTIDQLIGTMGPLFLKCMRSPSNAAFDEFMELVDNNILAIDATFFKRLSQHIAQARGNQSDILSHMRGFIFTAMTNIVGMETLKALMALCDNPQLTEEEIKNAFEQVRKKSDFVFYVVVLGFVKQMYESAAGYAEAARGRDAANMQKMIKVASRLAPEAVPVAEEYCQSAQSLLGRM